MVLLAIIAGFVFWKVSDIGATSSLPASERQAKDEIVVEGHQYYWNFTYPNGAISVDTLRIPYNRTIKLTIRSADVDHSWWIPALGGKLDAIPGKTNHLTFRATKLGTFEGQCAEFCGLLHAAMLAHVQVLPADEYDSWVSARANAQLAVGKETFVGVCAKCHGLAAQGGVGPNIAHNPLLGDKNGISKIIRHGTGQMPAVGNDWSQEQLDATIAYLQQRFRQERVVAARAERPPVSLVVSQGRVSSWLTTVDHKRIGILYIVTSLAFFLAGGVLALLMRAQLATPNEHIVTRNSYNELFTMHGTTMIFLVVVPIWAGLGNYLVPLMIGARDMAFPRLNALSYWLFLFGGIILYSSWFAAGGAPRLGGPGTRRSRRPRTRRATGSTSGSCRCTC